VIHGLTIPGTGTHFLRELLKDEESNVVHIWPNEVEVWSQALHEHDPSIIVPLRHPMEVAKSWKRRPGRGLELDKLPYWWQYMIGLVDPAKPWYLPLDVPDRDGYLDQINFDLGLSLKTDWAVKREELASIPVDSKLTPVERRRVQDMIVKGAPFFSRFGYE
jgi:hypothetical protein